MNLVDKPLPFSRILLVDDMPSIHEDFRKVLTPADRPAALEAAERALFGTACAPPPRVELDCASSGEEGLRFLRSAALEGRPYGMAFVDMRMPAGWDGLRTIEELWREDDELQVVICTAYSDSPLEAALARLGSPDRLLVLKKPFDPIEVTQLASALTAKRQLAHAAKRHLGQLEKVLQEMQAAAGELRRRNRDLEAAAAHVSQTLRSPLATIGMLSSLLSQELRGHRGDRVAEYLDQLREGARNGEQMIDGVLALADIARAPLAAGSLDLSRIARELVGQRQAREPGREVFCSVQDGLRAWGDEPLLRLALGHLLDNAWKFTSQQKVAAITVGMHAGEDEPVFFVRDSGCGFDVSRACHLFHRFERLHPPGEYPGAGVGLAAVGRVIERHGGRVWADSHPARGTTVSFTLPLPLGHREAG